MKKRSQKLKIQRNVVRDLSEANGGGGKSAAVNSYCYCSVESEHNCHTADLCTTDGGAPTDGACGG